MAEEKKEKKSGGEASKEAAPAGGEAAAGKSAPALKASVPAFSKKGLLILGGIVVLEAVGFMFFLSRGAKSQTGELDSAAISETESHEKAVEEYLKGKRSIIELGDIEVPITSTQPRAPKSISAPVSLIVNEELIAKFSKGGGGHGGGGGKATPNQRVLELNVRSVISRMMAAEGIRLLEPSAIAELGRKAKDRLNNTQVDGDEDTAQVLKVLRGQVLQVMFGNPKSQSY